MDWLFPKKNIVVLDLGSDTVKLAEFSIKNKNPTLESFAFLPVSEDHIAQGDLLDVDFFVQNLPQFISTNVKAKQFDFYICLSGKSVIVKKIEILKAEKKLIDTFVYNEIKQNLPWSVDKINYDYYIMKDHISTYHKDKINILLVVAKLEIIKKINTVMDSINQKCTAIDMGGFATGECIKFIYPEEVKNNQNILILNIGKSGTVFTVLNKGDVIFSHYIKMGSDVYTINLMRDMDLDRATSEKEKKNFCISQKDVPQDVATIMSAGDKYISAELFGGYTYFKNQFPNEEISYIYVTGGGGKITNLIVEIQKQFNVPTELLEPFKALKLTSKLEGLESDIQHFISNTLGACLRGIQ